MFHKPEGSLPEAKRLAVSAPAPHAGTRASGLRIIHRALTLRLARTTYTPQGRISRNYGALGLR